MNIGASIKKLRKERRLTLLEIAQKTGIDTATLSRIENGKMIGTVQSHYEIAKVLGVRLSDLYDNALESDSAQPEAAPELYAYGETTFTELLTPSLGGKKMIPLRMTLKAGAKTFEEKLPVGAERFLYVLRGAVTVHLKGSATPVGEGRSIYFNASQSHYLENPSPTADAGYLIVTAAPAIS